MELTYLSFIQLKNAVVLSLLKILRKKLKWIEVGAINYDFYELMIFEGGFDQNCVDAESFLM